MAKMAYIDDNALMSESYRQRDYQEVRKAVLRKKDLETVIIHDGEVFGFEKTANVSLTALYGFPCYVIKFLFSDVNTLHNAMQEKLMADVCRMLADVIESDKGYYNLRVPTHLVDLVRALNKYVPHGIFCGGTVEEVHVGELPKIQFDKRLKTFFADEPFIRDNRKALEKMAYESFENYQGQYHISEITSPKAGSIYRQWIANALDNFKPNSVLISEVDGEIAGYTTVHETETSVEGVLASINQNVRSLGAYKAMIYALIKYSIEHGKGFISSTQFDNFIVQAAWSSLGMRPFYSIYNIHIDNR